MTRPTFHCQPPPRMSFTLTCRAIRRTSGCFGLAAFVQVLAAAPGQLDVTFGSNGGIVQDLRTPSSKGTTQDEAPAFAVQTDGKILLGGHSHLNDDTTGPEGIDFSILRLLPNGTPDTTFSGDGMVTTDFSNGGETVKGLAVQADGKIVAVGQKVTGSFTDLVMARYHPDGSLDTGFAGTGKKTLHIGAYERFEDVAIQPDGKILAAGTCDSTLLVARFLPDGAPDPSFSGDGIVRDAFAGFINAGHALHLLDDGRILVAGSIGGSSSGLDAGVACYTPAGALDPSFSEDGWFSTGAAGRDETVRGMTVQADGKIVLTGSTGWTSPSDVELIRLHPDGTPDDDFGTGGKMSFTIGTGGDHATAVREVDGGKLLLAGYFETEGRNRSFLARILAGGTLDPQFGGAGIRISPLTSYRDEIHGLAVLANGRILAGGTADLDFAASAYLPTGASDPAFGGGGARILSFGVSNDYPRTVLVQPDGSIVVAGDSHGGDFVPHAAITRCLPDGRPDPSFGTGGKVTTPLGAYGGGIEAAALQADGKILLAGNTSNGACVLRYLPDGRLDPAFPAIGLSSTGSEGSIGGAYAIAVQPDGKIIIAGSVSNNGNPGVLVARFLSNGTLDPDFSGDGKAVASVTLTNANAYALALQPDGRIVVGGSARGGNGRAHLVLLRFDAHGELDPEFSDDGKLTSDLGLGSGLANAVAVLPDGRILAAGNSWNGSNNDAVIVRLLDDGTFDPSFSADGVMKISRTPGSEDVLESLFPQEDGSIVAGGRFVAGTTGGFATTRVLANGNLDTTYGTNGLAMVAHGVATELLAAGAVQEDGRLLLAGQGHTEHDTDFLVFRVEGPPEIPYRLWAAANGLAGDDAAPEAMPFGDGVDNLSKYAFNMNGGGPDKSELQTGTGSSGLPLVAVTREAGGVRLRFEFVRRRASGLDYAVLRSESLAPGSYLALGGTTVVSAIDRYWERVVVERRFDPVVMPRNFGVLHVGFPD